MHTHMHTHFIPKDKKKTEENNLKLRVLFLSLLSICEEQHERRNALPNLSLKRNILHSEASFLFLFCVFFLLMQRDTDTFQL
jgi:hypothetical protein